MKNSFNAKDYIEKHCPFSVFIVQDNIDLSVKAIERHPVTRSDMLHYQNGTVYIVGDALNREFEEFKDKHIGNKEYVDLPDNSFLRIDIPDLDNIAPWHNSLYQHTEFLLCFSPKHLTYQATFKEVYQERELVNLKIAKKNIVFILQGWI